ncbi:hypothetical protein [Pseudomonas sp. GV071]|uniref:hypothetical protein n=1 Tax=Pseudomonas sp. GV071 TaxID=2135754 RepID=UPI000D38CC5F|nr:hypothetical protein [Pseudomonas sp. GV071]PTQ70315.1 hypothetical protein C8K61_10637 [Pseudomonas sp. GV071]
MKYLVLVLALFSLHVQAAVLGNDSYAASGAQFPDESSPEGLPEAIPCLEIPISYATSELMLHCMWFHHGRTLTEWSQAQNREIRYPNSIEGTCANGKCLVQGRQFGGYPERRKFKLSLWYYIGVSSDGKPVAYLKDHGPSFGESAVSYFQAGEKLWKFYETYGVFPQKQELLFGQLYKGGMEQFNRDRGTVAHSSKATAKSADPEQCLNAWITAYHDDVGEDAIIVGEQLDEWKGWCGEGKLP